MEETNKTVSDIRKIAQSRYEKRKSDTLEVIVGPKMEKYIDNLLINIREGTTVGGKKVVKTENAKEIDDQQHNDEMSL